MANIEVTELADKDIKSVVMKATISVCLAINLGCAGALSPLLYAALVATGFGLAGWLVIEHAPGWLLALSVFARFNVFKNAQSKMTITDMAGVLEADDAMFVTESLLSFDPLESSLEFGSPSDILRRLQTTTQIFKFALNYNKESPEIATRNLRFVVKEWGVKPETKIIWLNAIKKIEFHNDGQAMANLFHGGEPPVVTYMNAQGQPVSCWEDSVKLPSQMLVR